MPASDHRRTAKKLAGAGRWAEAVQVAQERGCLDDALLLRAMDGLADQVMICPRSPHRLSSTCLTAPLFRSIVRHWAACWSQIASRLQCQSAGEGQAC